MSREIKFRGKRLDNSEWAHGFVELHLIDGDLTKTKRDAFITYDSMSKIGKVYRDRHAVDLSTVGEFTGLHDKNGKEIYEGDILDGSYIHPLTEQKVIRHYQVEFNRGNFYASLIGKSPYGDTILYFRNEQCEIIGNIYENPELL